LCLNSQAAFETGIQRPDGYDKQNGRQQEAGGLGYASRHPGGPPKWLVFIVGVAFVFGVYYVWTGLRTFLEEGTRVNPTRQALMNLTATMEERTSLQLAAPTRRPTLTPIPECQDFRVDTATVNVREQPGTEYRSLEMLPFDTLVCVLYLEPGTDWFLIDRDTETRRIEPGFIRSDLLRSMNPTATPPATEALPPSITPPPTAAPTETVTPGGAASPTPEPSTTPTQTPSVTPTFTPTVISINL
jgi:hypothetical protein